MNAVTQAEQTALTLPQRAAVALGAADYEIKIKAKVAASTDILAVIDPAGREQAHRIGMDLIKLRTGITASGEAAREDATAFSKAVISKQKELVALITPEETRIMGLRDAWDEKIAAEKAAKIAAESARTESIQAAIQAIRDIPLAMIGKSAQDISRCIAGLVGTVPDEFYQEFIEQAKVARHEALDKLAAAETAQRGIETEAESKRQEAARVAAEAEEARKAEAARIEGERQELAKLRAEAERIANEQAATAKRLADQEAAQALAAKQLADKAAANLRAERDAQELAMRLEREQAAKEQAECNRVAADLKRQLDEQQAAIAAERKALEDERAAAAQLTADHAEALLMDGEFNVQRWAQIESDHAEALEMNTQFDTVADLARCTATANAMLTQGRSLVLPESYCERDAMIDAGLDEAPTDVEIIDVYMENFGGTREQAIDRLAQFDSVVARAELLVAA